MKENKYAIEVKTISKNKKAGTGSSTDIYPTLTVRARTAKKGSTVIRSAFGSREEERKFARVAAEGMASDSRKKRRAIILRDS